MVIAQDVFSLHLWARAGTIKAAPVRLVKHKSIIKVARPGSVPAQHPRVQQEKKLEIQHYQSTQSQATQVN